MSPSAFRSAGLVMASMGIATATALALAAVWVWAAWILVVLWLVFGLGIDVLAKRAETGA